MQPEFVKPTRTVLSTRLRVLHERDFYRYIGASVAVGVLVSVLLAGLVLLLSWGDPASAAAASHETQLAFDHAAAVAGTRVDSTCGGFEQRGPAASAREATLTAL